VRKAPQQLPVVIFPIAVLFILAGELNVTDGAIYVFGLEIGVVILYCRFRFCECEYLMRYIL
jgi:hypothetical protein